MRLVLDTSVVVSAVRNPDGAAAEVLRRALRCEFTLLISVTLMCEYEDVLKRPEQRATSGYSLTQIDDLLGAMAGVGTEIGTELYTGPASADPNDIHVLSLAKAGSAHAVITYNTRHFAAPLLEMGVDLYTAPEFLRVLRREDGGNDR